jgi:FKBP-type peptidyl-prolyl cis-trans isomerase 2
MAGKELNFEIKLVEIEKDTADEPTKATKATKATKE